MNILDYYQEVELAERHIQRAVFPDCDYRNQLCMMYSQAQDYLVTACKEYDAAVEEYYQFRREHDSEIDSQFYRKAKYPSALEVVLKNIWKTS